MKIGSLVREQSALCRLCSTWQTKSLFPNSSTGTSFSQQIFSLLYFVLLFTQIKSDLLFMFQWQEAQAVLFVTLLVADPCKNKKAPPKIHCLLRYRYLKTYFPVAWDICSYDIFNHSFVLEKNKRKLITHQQPSFHFSLPACYAGRDFLS